jgi:hypothetical protein
VADPSVTRLGLGAHLSTLPRGLPLSAEDEREATSYCESSPPMPRGSGVAPGERVGGPRRRVGITRRGQRAALVPVSRSLGCHAPDAAPTMDEANTA